MAVESPKSERVGGSFRDPSGYVFWRQGQVYRAINGDCSEIVKALKESGLLKELTQQGLVVGTRLVKDSKLSRLLASEHTGYEYFLEHEPVVPVTYPYEWTVSMLADAAIQTLDLQTRLVNAGYSLKDATAYNILFSDGRPIFIDVPSIEQPDRLDLWFALGQFGQMFTFPLLLFRYQGWDLRSYFLGSINGREATQVLRGCGWLERWRPRFLLDVTLPALLQKRAEKVPGSGRQIVERSKRNPNAQLLNLQRLRSKVARLAKHRPRGVWADYVSTCSYSEEANSAKRRILRSFLDSIRPHRVLDLGCNVGEYSFLAAESGARVIAADADHDAVDILYQTLKKKKKLTGITPMVVDLSNPSPAIGFRNRERESFAGRVNVDCVLALALLHHLLVSGNLTLEAVRDLFLELTTKHLVLEFVPPEDVMFKRLMRFRVDLYGDVTLDLCRRVFAEEFDVLREEHIPGSLRTLLLLRRKTPK